MQDVTKLRVYGQARELAVAIYRLTGGFPAHERFGLIPQMRRAAVSIGSNIAEGCGRGGLGGLAPFLQYSLGSANELVFQLELAVDLGYCARTEAMPVLDRLIRIRRMLIRLSQAVARRRSTSAPPSPRTHHPPPLTRDTTPTPSPGSRASAWTEPSP